MFTSRQLFPLVLSFILPAAVSVLLLAALGTPPASVIVWGVAAGLGWQIASILFCILQSTGLLVTLSLAAVGFGGALLLGLSGWTAICIGGFVTIWLTLVYVAGLLGAEQATRLAEIRSGCAGRDRRF